MSTTYRVEFSPEAGEQAERVASWWIENRPAAPTLFRDELAAAVSRLEASPRSGTFYELAPMPMRRLLMPRSRYHIYYTVEETTALVRIHAVWHASRGHGPPL